MSRSLPSTRTIEPIIRDSVADKGALTAAAGTVIRQNWQKVRRRASSTGDSVPLLQTGAKEQAAERATTTEFSGLEEPQTDGNLPGLAHAAGEDTSVFDGPRASADTGTLTGTFESVFSSPFTSILAQAAGAGAATTGTTAATAGTAATGSAAAGTVVGGAAAAAAAVVGAAAAVAAAAGGSSGASSSSSTVSRTTRVVDGPIKLAKIYIDINKDGDIDPEDVEVGETDEQGYANLTLSADQANYGLIAKGGTDTETNKTFAGLLTAPVGSTVINPLTTLVAALMEGPSGKSLADAQTAVIAALGLTGVSNVTSYDAFEEAKAGTPSGLANHFKAIQVANIIVAGSAMVAGGGDTASAASSLIDALAGQINSTVGAVDLLSAQVLADVLTDAGANAGEVSAVASAIVAVNELIETAVQSAANGGAASQLMDDAVKAQVVAQVVLTGAIKQGNGGLLQTVASGAGDLAEAVVVGVVDNQAPSAPILSLAAGSSAEATSAEALAALTVKAEAGTLISLSFIQGSIRIDKRITADGLNQSVEWTKQELDRLSNGLIEVKAFAVDSASNNGEEALLALKLDLSAPQVSSVYDNIESDLTKDNITFTVTFSEALTGSVGRNNFTATDGTVTSVTRVSSTNAYTVVVTPTPGLASGNVALSLVGTGLADAAGNAVANADLSSLASQAIGPLSPIDLGYYGKLIKPVTVDGGKTYYFWDRWNVNLANENDLTGADLFTSTSYFKSFFRYDALGAVNPGSEATANYRFASINGVLMALPTVGGPSSPTPTVIGHSDQAVGSTANNPSYNDYLAIWDAYNGSGTTTEASNLNGTPPGWASGGYWAADVESNGRKFVSLNSGSVSVNTSGSYPDGFKYAAVEVLSVNAISSRENSGLTLVVDGSSLSSPSHYVGTQEADRLMGGAGDDTLWGGPGDDQLKGGSGKDLFIFGIGDCISPALWPDVAPNSVNLSAGFDWIQDFGDGDSVELSHFNGYFKDTGSPALSDRTYTVLRGEFNADTKIFGFDPLGKAALVIYDGNPSDDPSGLSAHFSSIVLTTSSAAGVPALDTSVQGVIRGDSTAPTLSGASPTIAVGPALAGSAGNSTGETIALTLNFDGPVIGLIPGDTNNTIFTVGGSGVSATWSGTGNTRTLTYTVTAGQNGQAAINEAALKQALIAGLTDAAGNAFAYSGNIPNIDAIPLPVIDTTAPTLAITTPISGGYINNMEDESSLTIVGTSVGADGQTVSVNIGGTSATAIVASGGSWTATLSSAQLKALSAGTIQITANVSDAAGNAAIQATASYVYDTTVPSATLTNGAYLAGTDTLILTGANFSSLLEAGENASTDLKARLDWTKLLWDVNGDDGTTANVDFVEGDIASANVSNGTTLTIVLMPSKAASLEAAAGYAGATLDTLDITAGFARDVAGNAASTDAAANAPLFTHAGQSVIDLGSYGQLIAPVQVEGKWYYHWDRNDNGSNTGDLYNYNGNSGLFPLSEISNLFRQDIAGDPGSSTNNTYRYATVNGIKLALPTLGVNYQSLAIVHTFGTNDGSRVLPGTSISDPSATSSYDDLSAIWDAYNGTLNGSYLSQGLNGGNRGSGGITSGAPATWFNDTYVSATPWAGRSDYAAVRLYDGLVLPNDIWAMNVALQVL